MNKYWKWFYQFATCYFGDDDGGGGGDGGGDDDKGGGSDDSNRIATLEQTVNGLANIAQNLASGQVELQKSLATITESLSKNKSSDVDDDDPPPINDDDLETMSRKDLIAFIQNGLEKTLEKKLGKVSDDVKSVGSRLDEAITSVNVEKFQKDHPDLMEWKAEIAQIFKSGRASTVSDAYTLARSADPDKAKKVDAKYAPAKPDDGGKSKIHSFTGFPPGGTGGSGGKGSSRMTATKAAEAAWEEATAAMPGIDQFLTDSSTLQ